MAPDRKDKLNSFPTRTIRFYYEHIDYMPLKQQEQAIVPVKLKSHRTCSTFLRAYSMIVRFLICVEHQKFTFKVGRTSQDDILHIRSC